MEVVGKVIKVGAKTVTVLIPRGSACAHCGLCQSAGQDSLLEAESLVQVKEGDLVKVVLPDKTFLKATFLVYLFPLIFFIFGYLFGSLLSSIFKSRGEGMPVVFSFVFLGLAFFLLRLLYSKHSSRASAFLPRLTEVVSAFATTGCDYEKERFSSEAQA